MGSREPLPGWVERDSIQSSERELDCGPCCAWVEPDWRTPYEWGVSVVTDDGAEPVVTGKADNRRAAQLAAEDAARAMVADMATALGGSVTWATEGGE